MPIGNVIKLRINQPIQMLLSGLWGHRPRGI